MTWEIDFLNNIQELIACPFLDAFFKIFTNVGSTAAVICFLIILLAFKKTRKIGIQAACAAIICLILGNCILKPLIGRARPFTDPRALIDSASLLIKKPTDGSFPSGHTMHSFSLAFTIFLNNKKWGFLAVILAFMIAFSRMYLFVHFPTDILSGMLLGAICALLSFYFVKPVAERLDFTKR